jgi:hypothetical protein
MSFVLQVVEMEAEEDFKVVEEVGVETEEAEFREVGIKVVEVAIKTGVEDMEGVIIVEVVTRIEVVVIRTGGAVIRIEEVAIRIEVVVMEVAIRIEGVVEEGVVVVEPEGGTVTIDRCSYFPLHLSLKVCDIFRNS